MASGVNIYYQYTFNKNTAEILFKKQKLNSFYFYGYGERGKTSNSHFSIIFLLKEGAKLYFRTSL